MIIPFDRFWGDQRKDHPVLTDTALLEAEERLGVKLPEEYVALLRVQNGGSTRGSGFEFPMPPRKSTRENTEVLDSLFGIVTDPEIDTAYSVLNTEYLTQEWDLPSNQVLLNGDGHTWVSLDYRQGPVPSVVWIDVECEEEIQIAPTFAAFLDLLIPTAYPDDTHDDGR